MFNTTIMIKKLLSLINSQQGTIIDLENKIDELKQQLFVTSESSSDTTLIWTYQAQIMQDKNQVLENENQKLREQINDLKRKIPPKKRQYAHRFSW